MREEIRASKSPPHKKVRQNPVCLDSDDEQPSCSYELDMEEQDMVTHQSIPNDPKYLLPNEDLDGLIKALRDTLNIEDTIEERSVVDELFGGLRRKKARVFPIIENLKDLIQDEWKEPEKRITMPKEFKNRMLFDPEETKVWDSVPKVDIPIAKVVKKTDLPFEDSTQLKDAMDRKSDCLLKKAWEASMAILKTNITTTSVSRTLFFWLGQLEDHLREGTSREEMLDSIPLLRSAAAFLADASAETIRFSAREAALSNATRRALWLRQWSGDVRSKAKLCSLPFSGDFLFGPELDEILAKAADKKKGFPEAKQQPKKQIFQSFRPTKEQPRFRSKQTWKQGYWNTAKGGKNKSFFLVPQINKRRNNDARVGGRLENFLPHWKNITSNRWVLSIIEDGYFIDFVSPPHRFILSRQPSDRLTCHLWKEVSDLLKLNVICPVHPEERGTGHYSPLFLIKKTKWDFQINYKLEIFEQMGNLCKIQNGINQIHYAFDTLQSLFMYLGSQGCLLSCTYPYEITKIFKICRIISLWGRISFSIYCITLWSLLSPPGFYQGHGRGSKISPNGRNQRDSILRRLPNNRRFRKDEKSSWESQEIREEEVCLSKDSYESSGDHDIMHPKCGLVPKSLKNTTVMDSYKMGQKSSSSSFSIDNPLKSEGITKMVEKSRESTERRILGPMAIDPDPNRRQQLRMGGSPSGQIYPGLLDPGNSTYLFERERTKSGPEHSKILYQRAEGSPCENYVGQHYHGCLSKKTRRYQIKKATENITTNIFLGRRKYPVDLGHPSEGFRKCSSRLPQPVPNSSPRMELERGSLSRDCSKVGTAGHRLVCLQKEFQSEKVLFLEPKRSPLGTRRFFTDLEPGPSVCFPSDSIDKQGVAKTTSQSNQAHLSSTLLAKEKLVPKSTKVGDGPSVYPTQEAGPSTSGTSPSSEPRVPKPSSLDPESTFLRSKGLSYKVIKTLKNSRKPVTHAIYFKIWKKFCSWSKDMPNQGSPNICQILDFLQEGFEKGLRPSTLRVQVSALSTYFDTALTEHRWVKRFFQACSRLRPTVKDSSPQWDLSLVLDALTMGPFEPIDPSHMRFLTQKTAFLIAITSARRLGELQALSICEPYLSVSEDRITLRLDRNFLPKIVSNFHRNQEIILPTFCHHPKNPVEEKWHLLDEEIKARKLQKPLLDAGLQIPLKNVIKSKVFHYLSLSKPIPLGPCLHHGLRKEVHPFEEICKAATWSTNVTFAKHYRLNVLAAKDLAFGRKVLQAVVPP
ncbi:uncharacterized protein [Engystomops pustulosus]|uniref:uncharacterized protein isoform X3 n=1 Tax=Engystomops pustulosus TaxID=76066 RepID=UPI003AFA4D7D